MPTILGKDDNGNPVQAMRYRSGLAHEASGVAGGVVLVALDAKTKFVSIKPTAAVKIEFGSSSVVASINSHGFLGGVPEVVPVQDPMSMKQLYSHISVYFVEDGSVYLSERE